MVFVDTHSVDSRSIDSETREARGNWDHFLSVFPPEKRRSLISEKAIYDRKAIERTPQILVFTVITPDITLEVLSSKVLTNR